jgi:hypothetical protein
MAGGWPVNKPSGNGDSLVEHLRKYLLEGPELRMFVNLIKKGVIFFGIIGIAAALHLLGGYLDYPWAASMAKVLEQLFLLGDFIWMFVYVILFAIIKECVTLFEEFLDWAKKG